MKTKLISFTTDKNGKVIAYRDCRRQMRNFRISVEAARLELSTGAAVEVPFRPYGRKVA